jgi:hypothetical protein
VCHRDGHYSVSRIIALGFLGTRYKVHRCYNITLVWSIPSEDEAHNITTAFSVLGTSEVPNITHQDSNKNTYRVRFGCALGYRAESGFGLFVVSAVCEVDGAGMGGT